MNESTEDGPPEEGPSVSRLAGQLEYLFEEHPEFRHVAVAELVARLNEEDRWARAIARYPSRSDAEVHGHLAEFHDRIGAVEVEQARQQVLARTDEPEDP
jgi:predicted kinase